MSRRARSALALLLTLAALTTGGTLQARAVSPVPSAAAEETTTTTTPNLVGQLLQKLLPTTTTTPKPSDSTAPSSGASGAGGSDGSPSGSATTTSTTNPGDRTVPPDAQRIIDSVLRTGSSNSLELLAALKPLTDQGMTEEEAALVGMGQFPVAGEAYWSDDWLMPRFTPAFHLHQGCDVFAARGTPVRAPVDGRAEFASEGAGGLAAYVTGSDGTYYYMAHLDRFSDKIRSGQTVKQGTVVGFVGSTGNADGGSPHLHFEIHPGGGSAVNPKPTLDRWVREAIDQTKVVLKSFKIGQPISLPRPLVQAGLLRRLDTGSLGGPTGSDGPQLWASTLRRDGTGARLTSSDDGQEVSTSWTPRLAAEQARALNWLRAQQMASEVLAPLTPKVLDGVSTRGG